MLTGLSGLSGLSGLIGSGVLPPPPVAASYLAYYDAASQVTFSGSTPANYGKVDQWSPVSGAGLLVQTTDANRMRLRLSGGKAVVYQDQGESSRTMANSTITIDKQACTIFVLVELGSLIVNGVAESHTLISIPTAGTTGELYCYKAGNSRFYVAWKDGTGTYVSSLEPSSSMNLIGVTLSTGAVQVHCNGASQTLAAAALSAGTVTGFRLNYGTLLYNEQGAYHAIVIYNKALSAGEVSSVVTWGRQRGAIYPSDSDVTQHLYMTGASRAVGYFPAGNMSHGRKIAYDGAKRLFRIGAFGGISVSALLSRARVEFGLLGEGSAYAIGTRWQNPNKRQVVLMEIPTADTTSSVAAATQITNLSLIRQEFRSSGYELFINAMPYSSSWSGAQRTICDDINNAMAALDVRRYGKFHTRPVELDDPTNLTYFNADGVHYTSAGYDVLYNHDKAHVEGMLTLPIPYCRGFWPLDGDVIDNSGWNHDLSLLNSPTFVSGLDGGQALQCATIGNHAAKFYAPTGTWDNVPLTVVAWFKVSALGSHVDIVCKQSDSGGSKNWLIYKRWSNHIGIAVSDTAVGELLSTFTVATDTWYGAAMVIDPVNGARLYTTTAGGDPSTFSLQGTSAWTSSAVAPFARTGRGALRLGNSNDTICSNVAIQGSQIYFDAMPLEQLRTLSPVAAATAATPVTYPVVANSLLWVDRFNSYSDSGGTVPAVVGDRVHVIRLPTGWGSSLGSGIISQSTHSYKPDYILAGLKSNLNITQMLLPSSISLSGAFTVWAVVNFNGVASFEVYPISGNDSLYGGIIADVQSVGTNLRTYSGDASTYIQTATYSPTGKILIRIRRASNGNMYFAATGLTEVAKGNTSYVWLLDRILQRGGSVGGFTTQNVCINQVVVVGADAVTAGTSSAVETRLASLEGVRL